MGNKKKHLCYSNAKAMMKFWFSQTAKGMANSNLSRRIIKETQRLLSEPAWISWILTVLRLAMESRYIEAILLTAVHVILLDYGTIMEMEKCHELLSEAFPLYKKQCSKGCCFRKLS
ncbi:uncharacterized protein LOC111312228 [Durio zibethinus]|uniref:Uncharacterized protein LOC111312228 n=1 Tax=Durio zibethinus TaxID=66656 RepID=A0A6P6AT63_DURZI|nr:uncharacterized protein LOC111312228 [Durio zibethinus]